MVVCQFFVRFGAILTSVSSVPITPLAPLKFWSMPSATSSDVMIQMFFEALGHNPVILCISRIMKGAQNGVDCCYCTLFLKVNDNLEWTSKWNEYGYE